MPALIRTKVILEWCELKRSEWHHRVDIVGDRDRELQAVNSRFGFVDTDGTIPIGRLGSAPDYLAAYAAIESKFREVYDMLPDLESEWINENQVTVFEYLLMNNYELGDAQFFRDRVSYNVNAGPSQVIRIKAESLLKYWTEEYRIAGVKARMDMEIADFSFAARRCRKFFEIRPWEMSKKRLISLYKQIWTRELREKYDRLQATLP